MTTWYGKVVNDPTDITPVLDACDFFEDECAKAVEEISIARIRGIAVVELQKRLPGLVGYRFRQLQEIEAILELVELREIAIKGARRRHYLESYNRTLTPTTAEKYVESDDAVLAIATVRNRVALVRNTWLGVTKEHESLHFQLGNITKMIAAGVDEALM